MRMIQNIKNLLNPIYFDRMVAKGSLKQFLCIIMLLPVGIWFIGVIAQFALVHIFGASEPLSFIKDGLFWDTYENYINPGAHQEMSFSRRLYLLIAGVFGVFLLNGILVSAIVSWVEKRSERWKSGELRYDKKRWFQRSYALNNYDVIIGGNEMVPNLIGQILLGRDSLHVLVMTNRDVSVLRKKIVSVIGKDEERVVIYHGERTLEEDLSHLQIERANCIHVIGEQLDIEQNGSHHDVKNMECVKLLAQLLRRIKQDTVIPFSKKMCRVMFEYQSSFSVFQFTDVNSDISSVLKFRPFNYYETWAQKVLVYPSLSIDAQNSKYLPLEGDKPITPDSNETVHLIVVGMSRMGVAMGIEAAHIAHYPKFIKNQSNNLRTRITFIDAVAKNEMQYIQGHYKELFALSRWRYIKAEDDDIYYNKGTHIPYAANDESWNDPLTDSNSHSPYRNREDYTLGGKIVDVDWEFIQGNLEMPTVQCYIREATAQKNVKLTIAICFSKDNASFAASLYLPDEVYDENNNVVQVLAYQPYGDAMCQCFKNKIEMTGNSSVSHRNNFNQFAKLKAFGMMSSCYNIKNIENMEAAANQLWEQYSSTYKGRIGGRNEYRKKLGKDVTIKAGKSLAASLWSNNYAAAHLWTKLRSIGWDGHSKIDKENLTILAQLEHVRWNTEQLLLGYAPLRPEEQKSIKNKLKLTDGIETPDNELMQLSGSKEENLDPEQFPQLSKWLDAWKEFDEEREILKANMSHIDICSYEVLEKIDKEAIKYDEDLTRILPKIYENTVNIYD